MLNAAQNFFHFWRFWVAYLMPCTQDTPLHFTESDDMYPSRKKSRGAAHRLHDTVNHGMMQSIRANGRTFTNQASIVFSRPISRQLCPRISGNPVRLESVHNFICKTVLAKTAGVKSILMTGGRKCLPPVSDGWDEFMLDLGSKSKDCFFCKQFQRIQAYDFASCLKRSLDGE